MTSLEECETSGSDNIKREIKEEVPGPGHNCLTLSHGLENVSEKEKLEKTVKKRVEEKRRSHSSLMAQLSKGSHSMESLIREKPIEYMETPRDIMIVGVVGKGSIPTVYIGMVKLKSISRKLQSGCFFEEIGGLMVTLKSVQDERLEQYLIEKCLANKKGAKGAVEKVVKGFKEEHKILAGLNHPNIMKVYGALKKGRWDGDHLVVCEHLRDHNLEKFMRETTYRRVQHKVDTARHIFKQILEGLKYIHEKKVVHCDIKPQNIIGNKQIFRTDKESGWKIANLWIGKEAKQGKVSLYEKFLRSVRSESKEFNPKKEFTKMLDPKRVDLYSFGVTLYVFLVGSTSEGIEELVRISGECEWGYTVEGEKKLVDEKEFAEVKDVIRTCFDFEENAKTITAEQMLQLPFFSGLVEFDKS